MGIVENMQHLERYGGVSRGKFDGQPLENGECSSPVVPKFKRRKVSAVRDFPDGCGRSAPQVHARPAEGASSVGGIGENSAGGRYTGQAALKADYIQASVTGAESQSPQPLQGSVHIEVLKSSNNLESNVEKPVFLSDMVEEFASMNDAPEGIELPVALDAGLVDSLNPSKHEVPELPKKSQKTETTALTEDMVLSSGLQVRSPSIGPTEGAGSVGGIDENSAGRYTSQAVLKAAYNQASVTGAVSQSPQALQGSVHIEVLKSSNNLESNVEKPVILSNRVEGIASINYEPERIELPMALDNAGLVDSLNPSKHEVSELPKKTQKAETTALTEDMVLSSGLQASSPPTWPMKDDTIVDNTLSWNYPPRRKIFAIREFPLLCGRNAPLLSQEDCMKALASSKRTSLGQERSAVEEKPMNGTGRTHFKEKGVAGKVGKEVGGLDGKIRKNTMVYNTEGRGVEGKVRNEIMLHKNKNVQKIHSSIYGSKTQLHAEDVGLDLEMERVVVQGLMTESNASWRQREGAFKPDQIMLHKKNKSVQKVHSGFSGSKSQEYAEDGGLDLEMGRVVVQGLMSTPNCPWRQQEGAFKPNRASKKGCHGKTHDFSEQGKSNSIFRTKKAGTKKVEGQSLKRKCSPLINAAYHYMDELGVRDEVDFIENDEEHEDFHVAHRSREFNVSLPPFGQSSSSGKCYDHHAIVTRNKVRETLRIFQVLCRKILQGEEAKSKQGGNGIRRIDLLAAKIVKNKGKYVNTGKQILGPVPGVEVGDEFQYRVELAIVGLHRPFQAGIDYLKQGTKLIATSVVASGAYADDLDDPDVLIYMGAGGNIIGVDKQPEDQKLERGNLALKNSAHAKSPVRVIRGFREMKASDSSDARPKVVCTYTYDGLYLVDQYWQEPGPHGKLVFQFQLVRIPGQPELAWNEVNKSKKLNTRQGVCVNDISEGKELIPICAINTINDEKPPQFKYISRMIYPSRYYPIPPTGCGCTDGCLESERCSCTVKNGLEIPYNHNGAIVEVKPVVYECGPSCKCPSSCYNRVSQHGIKFQLEIFRTECRGWGVRSVNSIPSGSFICEYLGELLNDKEAEQRTGSDEYLFDIGQNYNECGGFSKLMDPHSSSCEVLEEGGFTIDAAHYGNVGRFINHCCSPNLYAQNVLYDHEDWRMPHIMLFAAENIPPLQELTYHYNYTMDQVYDSNGNIKKKSCYCGSSECVGRMY